MIYPIWLFIAVMMMLVEFGMYISRTDANTGAVFWRLVTIIFVVTFIILNT